MLSLDAERERKGRGKGCVTPTLRSTSPYLHLKMTTREFLKSEISMEEIQVQGQIIHVT